MCAGRGPTFPAGSGPDSRALLPIHTLTRRSRGRIRLLLRLGCDFVTPVERHVRTLIRSHSTEAPRTQHPAVSKERLCEQEARAQEARRAASCTRAPSSGSARCALGFGSFLRWVRRSASTMPAFAEKLSDEEIWATLALSRAVGPSRFAGGSRDRDAERSPRHRAGATAVFRNAGTPAPAGGI